MQNDNRCHCVATAMLKLLVPVDGSAASLRAVRFAATFMPPPCEVELHLLNVQQAAVDWEVRRFLRGVEIDKLLHDKGREIVEEAAREAQAAGRPAVVHVEVGEVAPTIDAVAKRLECGQIVMGSHGAGALEGLLMGSVSAKVLQRTDLPVTLIK